MNVKLKKTIIIFALFYFLTSLINYISFLIRDGFYFNLHFLYNWWIYKSFKSEAYVPFEEWERYWKLEFNWLVIIISLSISLIIYIFHKRKPITAYIKQRYNVWKSRTKNERIKRLENEIEELKQKER